MISKGKGKKLSHSPHLFASSTQSEIMSLSQALNPGTVSLTLSTINISKGKNNKGDNFLAHR